jgi:hypothetical protein
MSAAHPCKSEVRTRRELVNAYSQAAREFTTEMMPEPSTPWGALIGLSLQRRLLRANAQEAALDEYRTKCRCYSELCPPRAGRFSNEHRQLTPRDLRTRSELAKQLPSCGKVKKPSTGDCLLKLIVEDRSSKELAVEYSSRRSRLRATRCWRSVSSAVDTL